MLIGCQTVAVPGPMALAGAAMRHSHYLPISLSQGLKKESQRKDCGGNMYTGATAGQLRTLLLTGMEFVKKEGCSFEHVNRITFWGLISFLEFCDFWWLKDEIQWQRATVVCWSSFLGESRDECHHWLDHYLLLPPNQELSLSHGWMIRKKWSQFSTVLMPCLPSRTWERCMMKRVMVP